MDLPVNPIHLAIIKSLTLSVAGIGYLTEQDCRKLSFLITEKTTIGISENTLKRIFGFVSSRFQPSLISLNTLANYCGYESWAYFCWLQPQEPLPDPSLPAAIFGHPLVNVLLNTADCLVILNAKAPQFAIITYNKAYEKTFSLKNKGDIRGLSLWQAFDQDYEANKSKTLLLNAFHEAVRGKVPIQVPPFMSELPSWIPHIIEQNWWNVHITPVVSDGTVNSLVLKIHNITDEVLLRNDIEQAIMKELTMAEDLATTNVKLNKAMENLAKSHQELLRTKHELEELNINLEQRVFERANKLVESEARQRTLIDNAPVAIAVLKGPSHLVETANKKMISYWGKDNSVVGKPLDVAIPELEGQPFIGILDEVYNSGVPYINPELAAFLDFNGIMQTRYFDMIYQPVQHLPGVTDSIYIVAVDITDHIIAKTKLQESKSTLQLAVTAANIGTWSFDLQTRILTHNQTYAQLLGWHNDGPLTNEQVLNQVVKEYRENLAKIAAAAVADGTGYEYTFPFKKFNDDEVIWLKVTGIFSVTDMQEAGVFSGIIMEVA